MRRISAGCPTWSACRRFPSGRSSGSASGAAWPCSAPSRCARSAGRLARRLTRLHPRRLRSALSGQANAILFARRLSPHEHRDLVLNPAWFRTQCRRPARPTPGERSAWARNRRVAQVYASRAGYARSSSSTRTSRRRPTAAAADAELARVLALARTLPRPASRSSCAATSTSLPARSQNARRPRQGAAIHPPARGSTTSLVRGLELTRGPEPWPDAARRLGDVLLSDHAPLEAAMMAP